MLLTIISLTQAITLNAAFDGIPFRPGKTQFNNSTGGYSSSSILAGLLYSQSRPLDLDVRQQLTCRPGYRMCLWIEHRDRTNAIIKPYRVQAKYTAAPRIITNV